MKNILIGLLLVITLLLGCAQTGKIGNTTVNETTKPAAEEMIKLNETPAVVEVTGTVPVTAIGAAEISKNTINLYSKNFLMWISGTNINRNGKAEREDSLWRTIFITTEITAETGDRPSASSGTIFQTRASFTLGERADKYVEEIPVSYPLENGFVDSGKAIDLAVPAITKGIKEHNNLSSNVTIDLGQNIFDLIYYEKSVKVSTIVGGVDQYVTVCINEKGNVTFAAVVAPPKIDCSNPQVNA